VQGPTYPGLTDGRYRFKEGITTLADGAITITIVGYDHYVTANTGTTQITAISGGRVGMIIRLHAGDNFTGIAHNANIQLKNGVDLVASEFPQNSFIELYYNGTAWIQQDEDETLVYNVKTYGAVGDGVTDDTAAITAAAAAALTGGIVFFPPGTYKTTSTITINKSITLVGSGMGTSIIDGSTISGSGRIFVITGEITATTTILTADAATGQPVIAVADASQFSSGDWIRVRSEEGFNDDTETKFGELQVIESISTNNITCTQHLTDTYVVAVHTAAIDKVTMLGYVKIEGLKFAGRGFGDNSEWLGIDIKQAENVLVKDCHFVDCHSTTLSLYDCVKFSITRNNIENSFKIGLGYGILVANSSRDGSISGNNFVNNRHSVTFGGNSTYGVQNNVTVDGNTVRYVDLISRIGSLHTHNTARNITFSNNVVYGGGLCTINGTDIIVTGNQNYEDVAGNPSILMNTFAKRITITGNHVKDTQNEGIRIGIDVNDVVISNNYIYTEGDNGIYCINASAGADQERIIISDNIIESVNNDGIRFEVFTQDINHVSITGNVIKASLNGISINDNGVAGKVRFVKIGGNILDQCSNGIFLQGVQFVDMVNNEIISPSGIGVNIVGGGAGNSDYSIVGNRIYQSVSYGIYIDNNNESVNSEHIIITGNTIESTGSTGIRFKVYTQNIDYVTISGNIIKANQLGIDLNDAGVAGRVRYVEIFSNKIRNVTTGINCQGVQYFDVFKNLINTASIRGISVPTGGAGNSNYKIHDNRYIACADNILDQTDTEDAMEFFNLTLQNTVGDNANEGRPTELRFRGERAPAFGGFATLAMLRASHVGTGNDDKGKLDFHTNTTGDGEYPHLQKLPAI